MVTLNIGDSSLAFVYHGQCVYYYPVHKISNTEFEMIWARDMDCKFDNGTSNQFGLKKIPQTGKAFARYKMENKILKATYYFPEWVEKYSKQIAANVFTSQYNRHKE